MKFGASANARQVWTNELENKMIASHAVSSTGRNPGDPLKTSCQHKITEDCLVCIICGRCKEDLDSEDICIDCGGVDESTAC